MALDSQIPTVDEILERFPQLEDQADIIEQFLITEAAGQVGDGWRLEDQKPAIMYLVAHLATMETSSNLTRGQVTSESFGGMSRSYKVSSSDIALTEFGRRYDVYRRRNSAGILVVGGGL